MVDLGAFGGVNLSKDDRVLLLLLVLYGRRG